MPKRKKKEPLAPACKTCRWTGQVDVIRNIPDPQTGLLVPIYAQGFCKCPRGVWLEQMKLKRDGRI